MPDTLSREDMAAMRKRDRAFSEGDVIGPNYYGGAQAKWDRRSLLAHIDALTAAVEALDEPFQWLVDNYPKAMREMPTHVFRRFGEARAILRGEQ